jgi:WYL domain
MFAWIEEGRPRPVPAAFPLAAGDVVIRPPAGTLAVPGMVTSAPVEVIRFAASNRLCVELDYINEQGRRSVHVIEPYSLRRTQAGDIVLHAVRADNQQHRSYRIDRIRGARATEQPYAPRYAIELTPTGPISTPPTAYAQRVAALRLSTRSRTSARSGPIYVYECGYCNRRFEHSKRDPALREHKTKDGWRCPGRHGIWVDARW